MFVVELELRYAVFFEFVCAVEEIEHVPYVADHLFDGLDGAVFALVVAVGFGYAVLPIFSKYVFQLCYGGTAWHALCLAIIEFVWIVCLVADVLVLCFACYLFGYVFEVKVGFAYSVEEWGYLLLLVLAEGAQFCVVWTLYAYGVEE